MSFQMMKNRVTVYVEIVYWGGFSFWGKMDPFFSPWGQCYTRSIFREECQIPGLCFRRGSIYATTPVLKQLFVRKIF